MPFHPRVFFRKAHRWGAVVVALPFLAVILTGILLQLKKEIAWIQPTTVKGSSKVPAVSFERILAAAQSVPEAGVSSWDDIERLDVRPRDGIVKVQCKNRWEVQVDMKSGEVVQATYRRSDLIESIHDGSWFHESAKLYVFLPTALIVFGLWLTGMYLFVLPLAVKWRRRRNDTKAKAGEGVKG